MSFSENAVYISLKQASDKYGVSKKALLDQINSGTLPSVKLTTGEVLVADQKVDLSLNIKRNDFEHLQGIGISMSEASRKYGISHSNFSHWAKAKYINVLERGWKVLLNEADVAYCSAIYKAKFKFYNGKLTGVPIFDQNGNPYQAKYPKMAANRRLERQKKRSVEL